LPVAESEIHHQRSKDMTISKQEQRMTVPKTTFKT
jgi:hypothetical protein